MINNLELFNLIINYSTIVLVCVGEFGDILYQLIKTNFPNKVVIRCDNASIHQKKGVIAVEDAIIFDDSSKVYLIANIRNYQVIKEQLQKEGVQKENIFLGVTKDILSDVREKRMEYKSKPLGKLQFEVDLVSHCNLNCKCCSQFSPIAEEYYLDMDVMRRDFEQLSRLFGGECQRIYLIGGEPLLHPKIVEAMHIARDNFVGEICIFTNGILLRKQDELFYDVCKEKCIKIIVTKYPIDYDYEELKKYVENKGVEFEFFGNTSDYKYMSNLGLDLSGTQDINTSFSFCWESNNCIKLKDGKLYTCTRPAAIERFNTFFGENLEVSPSDYVDIFKEENGTDILNRLARPIPFCKNCKIIHGRKAMDWGRSRKAIEEWL